MQFWLTAQAEGSSVAADLPFLLCIQFIVAFLHLKLHKVVSLSPFSVPPFQVWTDASADLDPADQSVRVRLCSWLFIPETGAFRVVATRVSIAFLSMLDVREQQIFVGELLGPVLALLYFGAAMKGRHGTFFNDNMAAVHTLVKGGAKVEDAAAVAWAIHIRLVALDITVWWEWLQSASNPADGGTREGTKCPFAQAVGCPVEEVPCPDLPSDFPRSLPATWDKWWLDNSDATARTF